MLCIFFLSANDSGDFCTCVRLGLVVLLASFPPFIVSWARIWKFSLENEVLFRSDSPNFGPEEDKYCDAANPLEPSKPRKIKSD